MHKRQPEEHHYEKAIQQAPWAKAAMEGEESAQEDDKHYSPEHRSKLNPRILFGDREKVNAFLKHLQEGFPELKDKLVLNKLNRLAEILPDYSVMTVSNETLKIRPKDDKNKQREKEIMEILEDEKVADVLQRMSENEANTLRY